MLLRFNQFIPSHPKNNAVQNDTTSPMVTYSTPAPGAAAATAAFVKDVILLAPAPVLVPIPATSLPVVVTKSLVDVPRPSPVIVVNGPICVVEGVVDGKTVMTELGAVVDETLLPEPDAGMTRDVTPEPAQRVL
jgi:hypothetical protein